MNALPLNFLTPILILSANPRVVNWMEFPSHPSSSYKQFYLELEFHNPSIWFPTGVQLARVDVLILPQRVTQMPLLSKHSTQQAMLTLPTWTPLLELKTFPFSLMALNWLILELPKQSNLNTAKI